MQISYLRSVFSICFVNNLIAIVEPKYCYWNVGCPYNLFSSQTAYDSIRGDLRDTVLKKQGCKVLSIWSLHRTGQTHSSKWENDKIKGLNILIDVIESYNEGNSMLCAQDINNFQTWVGDDPKASEPNTLTEDGYKELYGIGKRLNEVFSDFLIDIKQENVIFRPAVGKETELSAQAYIAGLGMNFTNTKIEDPREDYDFISPFLRCEKYKKITEENLEIHYEVNTFLNSTDFLMIIERMQQRLGIKYNLSSENILSLYELCRFPIKGNKSPWCALFSTEDLRLLEYLEDLRHYYLDGHGTKINTLLGRAPLQDLYRQFVLAKEGNGKKIISYFTYTAMFDMMYAALGFFKDDKNLTGSHVVNNRVWRTSKYAASASNIVAVLNRCHESDSNGNEYLVSFYLNEKKLNVCKSGWCKWDDFQTKFLLFANHTTDICDT